MPQAAARAAEMSNKPNEAAIYLASAARVGWFRSDTSGARRDLQRARTFAQASGDISALAYTAELSSEFATIFEDHRQLSREGFTNASVLYAQIGDKQGQTRCIFNLALIDSKVDVTKSRDGYKEAMKEYELLGRRSWQGALR